MWCMWGNQNMQDENNQPNFPVGPDGQPLPIFDGLDGDFSKWNKFPSDLEPEEDAVVRPIQVAQVLSRLLVCFLFLLCCSEVKHSS
eukprot:TRINITY_DN9_c0_g1_i17.p2 TRINITY_DN9_c0_g1~~TRINITY_DN9_c0_g1_i17.p2  ORF type:complete len:86 (-),score=15.03 TRINITY_DN9_c0_g1_i17:168-425(-)